MRAREWVGGIALVLAIACGSETERPTSSATSIDHTTTGTIAGSVTFLGTPPAMAELPIKTDALCAAKHDGPVLADDALVRDGQVENAFVWLKDGLGPRVFTPPAEAITIDQRGCLYAPRVAGAQVGQPIVYVNSDAFLHNVHGTPHATSAWNFVMPTPGSRHTVTVDEPEVMIEVRCDIHPWMRSYLGVLAHPYFAVTGSDGRFTLADVPPGDYVVASWHERFGTREARVTLGARETKQVTFAYGGPN